MTQTGHVTYMKTRFDETNTVASISLLYLYSVDSYVRILGVDRRASCMSFAHAQNEHVFLGGGEWRIQSFSHP